MYRYVLRPRKAKCADSIKKDCIGIMDMCVGRRNSLIAYDRVKNYDTSLFGLFPDVPNEVICFMVIVSCRTFPPYRPQLRRLATVVVSGCIC